MGQWQTFLRMPHLPGLLWYTFCKKLISFFRAQKGVKVQTPSRRRNPFQTEQVQSFFLGASYCWLDVWIVFGPEVFSILEGPGQIWKVTGRLHSVQRTLANATWLRVSWSPGYFSHCYEKISDKNNLKKEGVWETQPLVVEKTWWWEHEGAQSHYFWGQEGEKEVLSSLPPFPIFTESGT